MQEISPLPNAGSELAIPPAKPIAPARPSAWNRKWAVAMIASCLLHAAAAAAFLFAPAGAFDTGDAIQSEGADQSGADVVGSALDGQAPGVMDVTLVPDPRPAKPEAVQPKPPTDTPQPAREATTNPPLEAAEQPIDAADILTAATPRQDDQNVAASSEAPASPATQTQSTEAPPVDESPAALPVAKPPVPTARPSATAGLGGTSQTNDARGAADGEERDQAVVSSKGKKQAAAGNAMESRYSGEIQKKLARANRRVSKSVQAKARNNARVVFVVMADGSISDLQLAESSGSAELDQFALTLVRQQAPFPPIPPETGRSSWVFKARVGPF
ncbi:energy transducer TonB [Mesorhizobium amorphae]|uniref:TonB family protein n=1 Tax=Mesorhizobium amorphae CCNWGS0123 TaxID=1082933 RepID=G6YCW8_9HYPH|nr:energy transducer TonB [Mesorhizobium amorphae]ANT52273.1 energy transducer TonB [Mesorhizobium amorphae CCNWGS0123]EHH10440.1 TonB family protein [Mesorhizobium amorphae CCNWGS0123]